MIDPYREGTITGCGFPCFGNFHGDARVTPYYREYDIVANGSGVGYGFLFGRLSGKGIGNGYLGWKGTGESNEPSDLT